MAARYHYTRESEDKLIVVPAELCPQSDFFDLKMGLDTGASHTIVDLNFLLTLDVQLDQSIDTVEIMTCNGRVTAYIFEVKQFNCLGVKRTNYPIMAYDFLAFGIIDIYEGLIGLDFFENETLHIDFQKELIWVTKGA